MGKVRDIMQKNVITIQEDKSALDAAKLISEKDISFLVIVKYDKPIGVITERDFVRKIAAQDKQASLIPLSEIMSYKFRWVVLNILNIFMDSLAVIALKLISKNQRRT